MVDYLQTKVFVTMNLVEYALMQVIEKFRDPGQADANPKVCPSERERTRHRIRLVIESSRNLQHALAGIRTNALPAAQCSIDRAHGNVCQPGNFLDRELPQKASCRSRADVQRWPEVTSSLLQQLDVRGRYRCRQAKFSKILVYNGLGAPAQMALGLHHIWPKKPCAKSCAVSVTKEL